MKAPPQYCQRSEGAIHIMSRGRNNLALISSSESASTYGSFDILGDLKISRVLTDHCLNPKFLVVVIQKGRVSENR